MNVFPSDLIVDFCAQRPPLEMANGGYLAVPKTPPKFHIPESCATVDVRVIDTDTLISLKPGIFWQPEIPNFKTINAPIYCFLISHGSHHIIFDLGVRKDWENYAPHIVSLIKATTIVQPGTDIATVLDTDESGLEIRCKDIEAVIWSHNHFDHIGDMFTFPPSTELIVGPGVREASWPSSGGPPDAGQHGTLESDIKGRSVREVAFDIGLKIGRFDAMDFFGDGSFYLLDAPGHALGHLCALARTTADPASFVFMGADACHHAGVLRPSEYLPLPRTLPLAASANTRSETTSCLESNQQHSNAAGDIGYCPGELLQHLTLRGSADSPFFTVAKGPLFIDHEAAMDTVAKMQELDALENIFVIIAHDLSIREKLPMFPKLINGWKASGLRTDTRWLFCSDFESALHGDDV